ncbi:hypothetical protein ABVT39_011207 [Epinephelus coioides]
MNGIHNSLVPPVGTSTPQRHQCSNLRCTPAAAQRHQLSNKPAHNLRRPQQTKSAQQHKPKQSPMDKRQHIPTVFKLSTLHRRKNKPTASDGCDALLSVGEISSCGVSNMRRKRRERVQIITMSIHSKTPRSNPSVLPCDQSMESGPFRCVLDAAIFC